MKIWPKTSLQRFALLASGVLLLITVFLVEEHIRGRIELNRYIQQMRARGEKFTIAELTPTPAPPEKNGAGMMMGVGGFGARTVAPNNVPGSMRYIAPGVAIAAAREPVWAIRNRGTFIATNGVTAFWRTNTSTETPRIRGTNVPMLITSGDLKLDVESASNSLGRLHAALEFPMLDYGLDYSAGFNIHLPHLATEKAAAQWLRTASLSALYETNHAEAVQNLAALTAFAHAKRNEPLLISQLVRIAIYQIGVSATWEALQVDGWTDEQLRELQTTMQPADFVAGMGRALEMERAMGGAAIERASDDPTFWFTLFDSNSQMFGTQSTDEMNEIEKQLRSMFIRYLYLPVWRIAWKDQDKLRMLQSWQTQINTAHSQVALPNWQKYAPRTRENSDDSGLSTFDGPSRRNSSFYDRLSHPFSSMLSVGGLRSLDRAVLAETARELAVTALALRRCELAQGKLPATLQELVPKFLSALPVDPCDGQPLRYRRNDDGTFLLYSVGLDGKDDGGNAAPVNLGGKPHFLDTRDIVWPRTATRDELEKFRAEEAKRLHR